MFLVVTLLLTAIMILFALLEQQEQGTTTTKTRVTADGTYATESIFVSAAGSREEVKYVLAKFTLILRSCSIYFARTDFLAILCREYSRHPVPQEKQHPHGNVSIAFIS